MNFSTIIQIPCVPARTIPNSIRSAASRKGLARVSRHPRDDAVSSLLPLELGVVRPAANDYHYRLAAFNFPNDRLTQCLKPSSPVGAGRATRRKETEKRRKKEEIKKPRGWGSAGRPQRPVDVLRPRSLRDFHRRPLVTARRISISSRISKICNLRVAQIDTDYYPRTGDNRGKHRERFSRGIYVTRGIRSHDALPNWRFSPIGHGERYVYASRSFSRR